MHKLVPSNVTDYSRSVKRGISEAIKAAYLSDCPTFKVGAALIQNSNIIGIGWNWFKKSAPDSKTIYNGIHAEFHCIRRSAKLRGQFKHQYNLEKLSGATLFVARVTVADRLAMSKPCFHCQELLSMLNLRRIYYTNRDGGISEMVLR
jgi:tRNA(Arg) A34 adenosine deaminase TadA